MTILLILAIPVALSSVLESYASPPTFSGTSWSYHSESIRSVNEVKQCTEDSLPPQAFTSSWHSQNTTVPAISSLKQLEGIPRNKLFLYVPRFGLGNALQAYASSLVFSILSGRRLVIVLAGAHWRSLHTLCKAFECPRDFVREVEGMKRNPIRVSFNRLKPKWLAYNIPDAVISSLHDNSSLFYGNSQVAFDSFWRKSEKLSPCVLALFDCLTKWCVHSRALQYMIRGPPSHQVQEEIEENLIGEIRGLNNQTFYRSVRINHASQLRFDVSIHIRTVSRGVEGYTSCKAKTSDKCIEIRKREEEQEKELMKKFTSDSIFRCVKNFLKTFNCSETGCKYRDNTHWKETLQFQAANKEGRRQFPMSIFFATDNVGLRSTFVDFLKEFGWVYYSNWEIAHTTRQGDKKGSTATMAEFFLLSRSDYVLAPVAGKKSTFGISAAQLGNSTYVDMRFLEKSCRSFVFGMK